MLYKGLSESPFILLILSLTRLLLGCINQGVFLKHCFHLSLSFSCLLHHTLWHDDTSGKYSERLENQAWVRGERAGRRKEEGSMVWGRWRLARKAEGVLEIAGPPYGENQDWNRKWERFCDKHGRVLR